MLSNCILQGASIYKADERKILGLGRMLEIEPSQLPFTPYLIPEISPCLRDQRHGALHEHCMKTITFVQTLKGSEEVTDH